MRVYSDGTPVYPRIRPKVRVQISAPTEGRETMPWDGQQGDKECAVYLIRCTVTSRRKIGESFEPGTRLKDMQGSSPTQLIIEHVEWFGGKSMAQAVEKRLHEYFGNLRLHGEWFDMTDAESRQAIEVMRGRK